ncbi:hypothetical protein RZ964_000903 [Acinetobacter baumannii]|nr:hypothetical protein [Acinetobacter baumannii]ELT0786428.1 hypothetical protein [Acinetobacter baumannii]
MAKNFSPEFSTSGYCAWRHLQAKTQQKYIHLKTMYWQHHASLKALSLVHDMRESVIV